MAAIEVNTTTLGKGKTVRLSTRVDMTPMVDLGFLLITFFMLATTMSKPTSMSVFFPDKTNKNVTAPVKASHVLTLFLGEHDDIYYLDGVAPEEGKALSELKTARPGYEIRNVIFAAQRRVAALPRVGDDDQFMVVIKPTVNSSYKNMVDIMDEMAITRSGRYALVDELTAAEAKLLAERK